MLSVMAFHAKVPYTGWGYLGVDVFFVLSGFLITAILLEEWAETGAIDLKSFYMRRILRLFPALSLVILISLSSLNPADWAMRVKAAAAAVFYCANWVRSFDFGIDMGLLDHTWSLSIEEQFYLLWPAGLILALRASWSAKRIALLLLTGAVISALLRATLWSLGAAPGRTYNGFDTRADGLLVGCLLAVLLSCGAIPRRMSSRTTAILAAAATPLLILTFRSEWYDGFMFLIGYVFVVLLSAAMLLSLVLAKPQFIGAALETPALVSVGQISYGLYLWHYPMFGYMEHLELPPGLRIAAMFAATFAAAYVSFFVVERPFLRLKRRFKPVPLQKRINA